MISNNPSINRSSYVGGSDIGHVLSIEPYGCARLLFYKKTGAPPDRPFQMSGVMEIGVAMEHYVAEKAMARTQWKLIRRGVKSNGHEAVHTDREIQKARDTPGVAEIKVIGDNVFWSWMRDGVAVPYILQLQWGMYLHERTWGAIIAWNRDMGGEPHIFEFDYNPDLMAMVRRKVAEFWSMVEARTPPPPLEPRDDRCEGCEYGTTCREQEWSSVADNGLIRIESPDFAKWKRLKDLEKDVKEELDAARVPLEAAIGDNALCQIDSHKISFKPQVSWRIDVDALKRDHPDLAASLMRKSISRPLRATLIKEK